MNGPSWKRPQKSSLEIAPDPSTDLHTASRKWAPLAQLSAAARWTMSYACSRGSPRSTSASRTRWEKNTPWVESMFARIRSGKTRSPSRTFVITNSM